MTNPEVVKINVVDKVRIKVGTGLSGEFLTKLDASKKYATITDMNTKANQTSLDDLKATVNANTQAISTKQPSGSYLTTTDASNTVRYAKAAAIYELH